MSVRQSLLAILHQGPCYGYQLRSEFERRTGATSPLNVGQIYNTLDRLDRDGLVEKAETDAQGHVFWRITDAGSAEVAAWLAAPVVRAPGGRDELAIKLAMAATLPGVDVVAVAAAQRVASAAQVESLRSASYDGPDAEAFAWSLVHAARVFAAEAELRWLDHIAERLPLAAAWELSVDAPPRGRPARTAAG